MKNKRALKLPLFVKLFQELPTVLIATVVIWLVGPNTTFAQDDPAVAELGEEFISNTVNVNGTTLHYVHGGSGPAVILLHGFPQDWYEFHKIMPRLAKNFTTIAVDLRGVGGSAATSDGYDAANMAKDIHQLAQKLGLENIYVAGHDIGGMVAYAFVRLFPKTTRGIMILDVPLPGIKPWDEVKVNPLLWHFEFHQTPDAPEKLIAGREAVYFREVFFDRLMVVRGAVTDVDIAHYANSYSTPKQLRAGLEFYRAFPANEKFNATQKDTINVPIVLAGGDKATGQTNPVIAKSLQKHGCTNVTVEIIKNSGHFVSEEQPEAVVKLIEQYARRNGGSSKKNQ